MENKDHSSDMRKIEVAISILKGGTFFFVGLFTGVLCHILAIDLLFGPISVQILPLPIALSNWWVSLAGPGIIPFLLVTVGTLLTILAIFQLYRVIFEAIVVATALSPRGLLFAKALFLTLIFMGFGPVCSFSIRLAWQSIFSSQ